MERTRAHASRPAAAQRQPFFSRTTAPSFFPGPIVQAQRSVDTSAVNAQQAEGERASEAAPAPKEDVGRWPLKCETFCSGSTMVCVCNVPGTNWWSMFPCGSCIDDPLVLSKRLNFWHGTRWSVAKSIPGNVKAVGKGDFAAGFYTHHDANDKKAWWRAWSWAIRTARDAKEKYAGVIKFAVRDDKYKALATGKGGKNFGLTSLDQADFVARQKDWLDFVTTHGRKRDPVFRKKTKRRPRDEWVHPIRDPAPHLTEDVTVGPMYRGVAGDPGRKPKPEEFTPFAERRDLPQQVVFANKGIDLLNSPDTKTEIKQYDADTGKEQDPIIHNDPSEKTATPSGEEVPMLL